MEPATDIAFPSRGSETTEQQGSVKRPRSVLSLLLLRCCESTRASPPPSEDGEEGERPFRLSTKNTIYRLDVHRTTDVRLPPFPSPLFLRSLLTIPPPKGSSPLLRPRQGRTWLVRPEGRRREGALKGSQGRGHNSDKVPLSDSTWRRRRRRKPRI